MLVPALLLEGPSRELNSQKEGMRVCRQLDSGTTPDCSPRPGCVNQTCRRLLVRFRIPVDTQSRLARLVRHFAGIYEPAQHREACNARGGGDQISNVSCYEFSVR
jgi:hypothetical protein